MNVFVAGVYGVGKTFICDKLSSILSIPHFSSSQIIKHTDVDKSVSDIGLNQQKLITGLQAINLKHPNILLDGHFCILTKDGMSNIGKETFVGAKIDKIVLLTQTPEVIFERLNFRKGDLFDLDTIDEYQREEVLQAKKVASELNIPIKIVLSQEESIPSIVSFIEGYC